MGLRVVRGTTLTLRDRDRPEPDTTVVRASVVSADAHETSCLAVIDPTAIDQL
ncbi:hypothetical protein ACIGXM_31350 [Kitasatospora sp. NPDC052896]|uniref:hypothetical protein n=1 Tax=Kitasatospora sp. NPDC052896 TaxID=3364061 RepID=UPI0037C5F68C